MLVMMMMILRRRDTAVPQMYFALYNRLKKKIKILVIVHIALLTFAKSSFTSVITPPQSDQ